MAFFSLILTQVSEENGHNSKDVMVTKGNTMLMQTCVHSYIYATFMIKKKS